MLAKLGDELSKQWLRDDDRERIAAYLERKGLDPRVWWDLDRDASPGPIANETDEEDGVA